MRVLVFTPAERSAPLPAVLWIHGGGMCVGTPHLEAQLSGRLVRDIGAVVVSPDYRLAPENPFPAALDDCMATLEWMGNTPTSSASTPTASPYAERVRAAAWPPRSRNAASTRELALRAQALSTPCSMTAPRCVTTTPVGAS